MNSIKNRVIKSTSLLLIFAMILSILVCMPVSTVSAASANTALSAIKVNGSTIAGFSADKYEYAVKVPTGTKADNAVVSVSAEAADAGRANVNITPAEKIPGVTSIEVIAEDGVTKNTYKVYFGTDDMAAWYTFDNSNSGTVIDASGNNMDATLTTGAAIIANGKVNNAVDLDGTSGYVQLPGNIVSGLNDVTVACWVYVKSTVAYQRVYDFGKDTSKYMYLLTSGRNDSAKGIAAAITTSGWSKEEAAFNGTDMEEGKWKHLAVSFSGSTDTLSIYEDGIKIAENKNVKLKPSDLGTDCQNNWIGKSQYGDGPFNGMIDDFRIYRKALNGDEIAAVIGMSDAQIVNADKEALTLGDISEVRSDITLPVVGTLGSEISWDSDNKSVIENTGKVKAPAAGQPDAEVTLTALIKKGTESTTKVFKVTVKPKLTDEEIATKDLNAIYLGNLYTVEADLVLPAAGKSGSAITWESKDTSVLTNDGKITRPEAGKGNAKVILVGTVKYGTAIVSKNYEVTILEKPKALVISKVEDYNIDTPLGSIPELPSIVTVVFNDGVKGTAEVTWDGLDPANFSKVGTVTANGTVKGTTLKAVANIKVTDVTVNTKFSLTKLEPGKKLIADVNITNSNTSVNLPALAIMALYNVDNALTDVKYSSKEIGAKMSEKVSMEMQLPDNITGNTVKVFVWNGTDIKSTNMMPLANASLLTDKAGGMDTKWSADPFALYDVSLASSAFTENRDRTLAYLLSLDDDRMLYNFRATAGLDLKGAQPLGGWDEPTGNLRGHSTGHYLSALAQAYGSAQDEATKKKFKDKIDYMVTELKKCQDALAATGKYTDGFLSAYPEDQFKLLEQYTTYPTIWAPYYTLHKIMEGFIDCYNIGGNQDALTVVTKMGDFVYNRLSKCTSEQRKKMWSMYIAGEFGGMNEVLAELYGITKDEKYLTASKYFDNDNLFVPMSNNSDTLSGMHANQHIPQVIGALQIFDQTGDSYYYNVANNFWNIVTKDHMYNIGGSGEGEMFKEPGKIAKYLGEKDAETCFTYNMLKLTRGLFFHNQDPKYMDYYERALYNDILASQNHDEHGGVTYFMPLGPGQSKTYSDDYNSFTCCHGTGMENHTKYQDSIYFKSDDSSKLYVNLYIPSTLNWQEKGFKVTQTGDYLKDQATTLTISGNGKLDLNLRVPYWVEKGFTVKINGTVQDIEAKAGTYISLNRDWKDGDRIDIAMPFSFRIERTPDDPTIGSIMYGPLVMVGKDSRTSYIEISPEVSEIKATADALTFTLNGVTLVPMYTAYDFAYHAYFKIK